MKLWFCLMLTLLGSVLTIEGRTGPVIGHATKTAHGLATGLATGLASTLANGPATGQAKGPATVPICKPIYYACDCSRVDREVQYHIIQVDTVHRTEHGVNSGCYANSDPEDWCSAKGCYLIQLRFEEDDGSKPAFYPVKFFIPQEEKMIQVMPNTRRFIRSDEICHIVPLKHAYVWCKRYENVTTCDIECQEGYFLQEGDESVPKWTTRCKHDENTWAPHEWQECFPAVSCKARLVKTGKLKCVEPVDSNPYCEISCYEDEIHDEVPLQRYDCYDDRFEDILPHCAVLDIDVKTVRKPKYWEW